jgi:hypothetical protein
MASLAAYIWAGRKSRFSLGLQAGYGRVGVDPTAMRWGNQYDGLQYNPTLPTGETNQFAPFSFADVNAGISYWYSDEQLTIILKTLRLDLLYIT